MPQRLQNKDLQARCFKALSDSFNELLSLTTKSSLLMQSKSFTTAFGLGKGKFHTTLLSFTTPNKKKQNNTRPT
jgi:hypothetical protein